MRRLNQLSFFRTTCGDRYLVWLWVVTLQTPILRRVVSSTPHFNPNVLVCDGVSVIFTLIPCILLEVSKAYRPCPASADNSICSPSWINTSECRQFLFNFHWVTESCRDQPRKPVSIHHSDAHLDDGLQWNIDLITGLMTVQWINTDGSKASKLIPDRDPLIEIIRVLGSPTTQVFVQSNHLYAGGDSAAFESRYQAPVTSVVSVSATYCD